MIYKLCCVVRMIVDVQADVSDGWTAGYTGAKSVGQS